MRRYGIFGGTFNPPHIGHSIFAENVREQLHLDKIIFIPSGNPPLKKGIEIIDAKHRLRMAEIAFEKDENFEVSNIEIKNTSEKSYTINTLIKLKELYQADSVKLFLILGIDNLISFPEWKEPEKLFSLSEVIIINRPGYFIKDADTKYTKKVKFINVPNLDISSSMIRDYIAHKKSIKYLVLPEVEKYIKDNNLYLT
jgi:nicotinate-nucleotide adenylyltransferase